MKRFSYLIITLCMFILPMFVLADDDIPPVEDTTPKINIITNLMTGAIDGDFTFTIKEVGSSTSNQVLVSASSGSGSSMVSGLKIDTDYEIELTVPSTHEFVSLESGTKIITNTNKIIVKTGGADSTTDVTAVLANKGGIASNKATTTHLDGTSTLSLSVTGKSNTTVNSTKANVLLIYDTSQSMKDTTKVYEENSTSKYGRIDYGYEKVYQILYRNSNCTEKTYEGDRTNPLYYKDKDNGNACTVYTGKRYQAQESHRGIEAEKVVHEFTQNLFAYDVEIALVTFNTSASKVTFNGRDWTSNPNDIVPLFQNSGSSYSSYFSGKYAGNTNWQDALSKALTVLQTADNDPTYVVFITDGTPTNALAGFTPSAPYYDYRDSAKNEAYNVNNYDTATHSVVSPSDTTKKSNTILFGIYTFGSVDADGNALSDYLDDTMYYAYNNKQFHNNEILGTTLNPLPTNYFKADDSVALKEAIDAIFEKIVSTVGFGNVNVSDGTTSQVKLTTSPGQVSSLLEVNSSASTYEYWLSMPVESSSSGYTLTRIVKSGENAGTEQTITFTTSGSVVNAVWSGGSATLEGTISTIVEGTTVKYILKYKWPKIVNNNSFYDFDNINQAPPEAVYNTSTGAIEWDLSTLGTLINNVTYTVDVEVWPSQAAQDLIADLMNDPDKYNTLDDDVRDYIVRTGNATDGYNFTLRTNTKALVSYTDSNNNNGVSKINNPDPISAQQKTITITKGWVDNLIDPDKYDPNKPDFNKIELYVLRDGVRSLGTITVNKINNDLWQGNAFLSMGIIKINTDGSATIVAKGSDQTFIEKDYHWDLTPGEDLHPMLINGEPTMLVKTADNVTVGSSNILITSTKTYYKIDGKIYEVAIGDTANGTYVSNTRRSNLNLKKTVIGDDPGGGFEFRIETTSSEELYFSITEGDDTENPIMDETLVTSGARKNLDENDVWNGYWITNNISTTQGLIKAVMNVILKASYNLRFTNVPRGTTFKFTEIEDNMPQDYFFLNVTTNNPTKNNNTNNNTIEYNEVISTNPEVSGTIALSNAIYTAEYKNVYTLTNIAIEKTWQGTATHPDSIDVTLLKNDVEYETVALTSSSNAEENWKHTWTGLVKYIDNGDGTYTENEYTALEVDDEFAVYDETTNALIGRWKWETSASGEKVVNVSKTVKVDPGDKTKKIITNILGITNIYSEALKQDLKLRKVSLTNVSTTLNGAKFKLYRYNEAKNIWVQVGDEQTSAGSGNVTFANLYAGSYRLVETKAPQGYILPKGEWLVTITDNGTSWNVTFSGVNIPPAIAMATDGSERYLIPNEELLTLPETGGFGIGNISLIGILVMLMSGIFLLINQRELLREK